MSKRTNLSYDDGMMIWKTRDAYRVQTVLLALFYLPQFLFALFALSYLYRGLWAQAAAMTLAIVVMQAARWVLCTGMPRLIRWGWRVLRGRTGVVGLLLVVGLGVSGCSDMAHQYQRTVWGIDCRQDKLVNGQCVAATQKGAK